MQNFIQKFLIAALMVSTMSPVIAAPSIKSSPRLSSGQAGQTGQAEPKAKTSITMGLSWKTKALAALSVAAAGVVAVVLWRMRSNNGDSDLNKLFKFEQQNKHPQQDISSGHTRLFMQQLQAHSQHFQQAMQNRYSRANIEELFNNPEFEELMNCRLGEQFRMQITALFDDAQILHYSTDPNFAREVILRFQNIWHRIEG